VFAECSTVHSAKTPLPSLSTRHIIFSCRVLDGTDNFFFSSVRYKILSKEIIIDVRLSEDAVASMKILSSVFCSLPSTFSTR
jgi:hypothetical protein